MTRLSPRILTLVLTLLIVPLADVPAARSAETALGLKAGTLGAGVELTAGLHRRVNIRIGWNRFSFSRGIDVNQIAYDGDADLDTLGALVDVHPFAGRFRVSAGLYRNDNGVALTASPGAPVTIGNVTYPPAAIGALRGEVRFRSTSPYLGIGWGDAARGGRISFGVDIGLLMQGSPRVGLTADSPLVDPADLEAERQAIEQDLESFDIWPVLSVGVAFRL